MDRILVQYHHYWYYHHYRYIYPIKHIQRLMRQTSKALETNTTNILFMYFIKWVLMFPQYLIIISHVFFVSSLTLATHRVSTGIV